MKQFKRDEKQNSSKLHLDKYYTPKDIVEECINLTYDTLGLENITEIIEPSAGNGAFSMNLEGCVAYDIEPEGDGIIKQDFLELDLEYKKGRLIIGNPPYGSRLNLAKSFCNKSFEIADYVAFILPISQLNNTQSIYRFDLIKSVDLGIKSYTDVNVHCCFNIYQRPNNGEYNKKISYKNSEIIEIIEIREIREVIQSKDVKRNRDILDFKYDFGICAWGNIGKECSVGEFAKSFFIKIKDKDNFDYYKDLILSADWESIYPMTNVPNLLQWQVYKYIEENRQ